MSHFRTVRHVDIGALVGEARNYVIYAAPGVSKEVVKSLMERATELGAAAVVVVLDVSAHAARLGFGEFDPIAALIECGIEVRMEPGLRQCCGTNLSAGCGPHS